jgi:uncharacterized protein
VNAEQSVETKAKREKSGRNQVHALQFNVAQLLKQGGSSMRTYVIENARVPALEQEFNLAEPLNGKIKFIKTDKEIFVTGLLHTSLVMPCTRCLEDVQVPLEFDLEETFNPTVDVMTGLKLSLPDDPDPATLISDQHILDLSEVARQAIHLYEPGQVLCREDCQGLCAQCGANLNLETCDCNKEEIDSRWAGLLALKDNFA